MELLNMKNLIRIGGSIRESQLDQACINLGSPPPSLRTCPTCGRETEPFAGFIDNEWRWVGRCAHECDSDANGKNDAKVIEKARRAGLDESDVVLASTWSANPHPVIDSFLASIKSNGYAGTYGLYLNGGVGSGKTVAAKSICLELVKNGTKVLYTTETDLFCQLRSSFADAAISESSVITRCSGPEVLFIDDLGKEKVSEYYVARLFQIIDRRDASRKPTVITTQLPLRTLERRLANVNPDTAVAIASRIMGRFENIVFEGPDMRNPS